MRLSWLVFPLLPSPRQNFPVGHAIAVAVSIGVSGLKSVHFGGGTIPSVEPQRAQSRTRRGGKATKGNRA